MQNRPASSMPLPASPISPIYRPSGQPAHVPPVQNAAALPFSEFTAVMERMKLESDLEPTADAHAETSAVPEFTVPPPAPSRAPLDVPAPQPPAQLRRIPDTHGPLDQAAGDWDHVYTLAALPDLRPLGQLHDSFIIAAGRDGLWLIDQHVAHERILFEQVLAARASGTIEVQQLLMPLVLQLTPAQQLEYARIADELIGSGFETEPFGQRTIAIKAAPASVAVSDIEKIVYEVLEIAEGELRSASLDEIRRNVCATIACRAAIKINTKLEPKKIEWLLRTLASCEYPMTCPHGRPIALRYSMRDILKSFHRL